MVARCAMWNEECEMRNVECGTWNEECGMLSVEWSPLAMWNYSMLNVFIV